MANTAQSEGLNEILDALQNVASQLQSARESVQDIDETAEGQIRDAESKLEVVWSFVWEEYQKAAIRESKDDGMGKGKLTENPFYHPRKIIL